jgi:hypothetical protein
MPTLDLVLAHELPRFVAALIWNLFPFVAYACLSPRVTIRRKLAWVFGILAPLSLSVPAGFYERSLLLAPLAAYAYFAVASSLVQLLRNRIARGGVPRASVGLVVALLFVAVPGALPTSHITATAVVIGWEMAFAAYSYCEDTRHIAKVPLSEALAFVLVNPVLVYPERGHMSEGEESAGFVRSSLGIAVLAGSAALYGYFALMPDLPSVELSDVGTPAQYGRFVTYHLAYAVTVYLAHSGRASFAIGAMRLLGFRIPERYRNPFASTNPAEFWRRWNLYLGHWARRYLFAPLSPWIRRKLRTSRIVATALAIMLTFLGMGALHDVVFVFAPGAGRAGMGTVEFFIFGIVLVAWEALARSRAAHRLKRTAREIPFVRLGLHAVGWTLLLHTVLITLWLTSPRSKFL